MAIRAINHFKRVIFDYLYFSLIVSIYSNIVNLLPITIIYFYLPSRFLINVILHIKFFF